MWINIPCSITIEVDDDFDIEDEEALYEEVVAHHGKYPEVDARCLGYELVEIA